MPSWPSPVVQRLSAGQLGLVRRRQLVAAGIRTDVVKGWIRRRRLEVVHRGVLRVAGEAVPDGQAGLAAVYRSGPRARLVGEHLLALYGVAGSDFDDAPSVLVPPRKQVSQVPFTVRHIEVPRRFACMVAGCVPAVRLELAVILEAANRDDEEATLLVDRARWAGLRRERLLGAARFMEGHPGAMRVLALAQTGRLDQESPGERRLDSALGSLGHLFRWQVDDVIDGIRFDAYCDLARLALEYDGRLGVRDADRDCERDLLAGAAGILVLHITSRMLRSDRWARPCGTSPPSWPTGYARGRGSGPRIPP